MTAAHVRQVVRGHDGIRYASQELALPALMLRAPALPADELVHVYIPHEPTVAFSTRDRRSPTIQEAVRVAREAGFRPVVRSPGGRMVAYDEGAVVIDHVDRTTGLEAAGSETFAKNAAAHAIVLERLGLDDVRIGEVDGEYCPGEFSVNVAGSVKVIGSAQRVTGRGALFSTVVQVDLSDRVRSVITEVSAALGYDLRTSSIGGLSDYSSGLRPERVADAFVEDYRTRLGASRGALPPGLASHALEALADDAASEPFHVDDWVRTNPLPS